MPEKEEEELQLLHESLSSDNSDTEPGPKDAQGEIKCIVCYKKKTKMFNMPSTFAELNGCKQSLIGKKKCSKRAYRVIYPRVHPPMSLDSDMAIKKALEDHKLRSNVGEALRVRVVDEKLYLAELYQPRLTRCACDISPKDNIPKTKGCKKCCIKTCSLCCVPKTCCSPKTDLGCCCCLFTCCCESKNDKAEIYAIVDLEINPDRKGEHFIQYWLPYSYNIGWPFCGIPCCCYCGFHKNDFENLSVYVNDNGVNHWTYSAHDQNQWTKRDERTRFHVLSERHTRFQGDADAGPNVYISMGSHALYPDDEFCGDCESFYFPGCIPRYCCFGTELVSPKRRLENVLILQKTRPDFKDEEAIGVHPAWSSKFEKDIRKKKKSNPEAEIRKGFLVHQDVRVQTFWTRMLYPLSNLF